MQKLMIERFLKTHPEAAHLPKNLDEQDSIEWFLRPRDA
jgi:hypothetical protein